MHIGSPLTGKATGEEHAEVPKKQSSVLEDKFLSTFFSAHHETATRNATNGNCSACNYSAIIIAYRYSRVSN